MKRKLTVEQQRASEERKARFRVLVKQIANMSELDRVEMSNRMGGILTVEGRSLSLHNTLLLALQCPSATVVGGFRQWLRAGRAVRKGQHGSTIWIPRLKGTSGESTGPGADSEKPDVSFLTGTVFDVSQTDPIEAPVATVSPELAEAFGMIALPNVRVEMEGVIV